MLIAHDGTNTVCYRPRTTEWRIIAADLTGRVLGEINLPPSSRPSADARASVARGTSQRTIGLSADTQGRIWIQDPRPVGMATPDQWWGVTPSGVLREIVQPALGVRALHANQHFVAALQIDEDGVMSVLVFRGMAATDAARVRARSGERANPATRIVPTLAS